MGGVVKSVANPVAKLAGGVGGTLGGAVGDIAGSVVGGVQKGIFKPVEIERAQPDARAANIRTRSRKRAETREVQEGRQLGRSRAQRQGLIRQLQQQAKGRGPSIAEAQLRQAQDRNLAQQLAAAGRARGGNSAAMQRQLARQQQESNRDVAQQAMVARMQEQRQAQQQLGQETARDQQLAGALQQQYLNQGMTFDRAQQQANMDLQRLRLQEVTASNQARLQQQQTEAGIGGAILGGLGQAGAAVAASDKNMKKDVKKADMKKDFLDKISASSYKYKEPEKKGRGKGEFASAMAQELEKSKFGKSMVINTPEGKMVDYGKGFGTIVAAQAELNKRLEALEKKKSKK